MKIIKTSIFFCLLMSILMLTGFGHVKMVHGEILWDYSPEATNGNGTINWQNRNTGQNFAERISFMKDVQINGMDVYSWNLGGASVGDAVTVRLWTDVAGAPDQLIYEFSEPISIIDLNGVGTISGIDRKHADFSNPFVLSANTYYWIGMSGNYPGLDLAQMGFSINPPDDGRMAVFNGTTFVEIAWWAGDMAFRLYGTVVMEIINDLVTFDPDPSTYEFDPDTTDCQVGAVGKFRFGAKLTNISEKELSYLHVEVDELTNNNLLLTDGGLIGQGEKFKVASDFENVALNADVELKGAPFFEPREPGDQIVSEDTIVDGIFLPRGQEWNQGPVWWKSWDGQDRYIELTLNDEYTINSFIVQADDNDAYKLYYRDMINNSWKIAWNVPNFDAIQPGGMVTRPNPSDNNEKYFLPIPITTDALLFRGNLDDGDRAFSVSEIQAFSGAENDYSDGILSPDEYVDVPFTVCLQEKSPFRFFVNVLGVAEDIDLEKGLLASYPFNGNANDESGNGYDGMVHGATLTEDRFGNPDSAYRFNGVNNYITIEDGGALSFDARTDKYSISVWVLALSLEPVQGGTIVFLVDRNTNLNPPTSWTLGIEIGTPGGDSFIAEFWDGSRGEGVLGIESVKLGIWYHVVCVVKSGTGSLFVNGQLNDNVNFGFTNSTKNNEGSTIGAIFPGPHAFFHGEIDDIRIYNRALSAAEIKALYNLGN